MKNSSTSPRTDELNNSINATRAKTPMVAGYLDKNILNEQPAMIGGTQVDNRRGEESRCNFTSSNGSPFKIVCGVSGFGRTSPLKKSGRV